MGIRGLTDAYNDDDMTIVEGYCKTCKRPAVKVTIDGTLRHYHPARVLPPGDPDNICPVLIPIAGTVPEVKSFDIPEEEFVAT